MSWRTGSTIFLKIWPIVKAEIEEKKERGEFGSALLSLFIKHDMDAYDLSGADRELDEIIAQFYGEDLPVAKSSVTAKVRKELNRHYNDLYKSLADQLNMKLFKDEDSVYLKATLGDALSSVVLTIFRDDENKLEYEAGYERVSLLTDESVDVLYRVDRRPIDDEITIGSLKNNAIEILNSVLNRDESDWDKRITSKTSLADYAKMIRKLPRLELPH